MGNNNSYGSTNSQSQLNDYDGSMASNNVNVACYNVFHQGFEREGTIDGI